MQDNQYWLGLLTHLQAECVPLKSLDCLRDLRDMYEAATVEDVYDAYSQVCVGVCVGVGWGGGVTGRQVAEGGWRAVSRFDVVLLLYMCVGSVVHRLTDRHLAAAAAAAVQV